MYDLRLYDKFLRTILYFYSIYEFTIQMFSIYTKIYERLNQIRFKCVQI